MTVDPWLLSTAMKMSFSFMGCSNVKCQKTVTNILFRCSVLEWTVRNYYSTHQRNKQKSEFRKFTFKKFISHNLKRALYCLSKNKYSNFHVKIPTISSFKYLLLLSVLLNHHQVLYKFFYSKHVSININLHFLERSHHFLPLRILLQTSLLTF